MALYKNSLQNIWRELFFNVTLHPLSPQNLVFVWRGSSSLNRFT